MPALYNVLVGKVNCKVTIVFCSCFSFYNLTSCLEGGLHQGRRSSDNRSSRSQTFFKIGVLKNFTNFKSLFSFSFLFSFFSFYLFIFFDKRRCVKSVRIRSYSDPYFHTFGLNANRYSVSLRIQSECEKIRTRKTPNTDTFHAVTAKNIYSRTETDCASIFAGKSISETPVSIQLQKQPPQVFC